MATNYTKGLYKEYELLLSEKEAIEAELAEKAAENEALKKEIIRLNALMNTDGTNSGTPTSKPPLSKKKLIPNTRKKSEKKIGGQPGHPKKKLEAFAQEEVTETEIHSIEECPYCGAEAAEGEKFVNKDELDYKVVVIKKRHTFPVYKCTKCGREFHQPIPTNLKEDNQYGIHVRSLALSLMNIGNVSVNKVRKFPDSFSHKNPQKTMGQSRAILKPVIVMVSMKCKHL